jgi:hypothetical protein
MPPSIPSWPLAQFIWAPFNRIEHTNSYAKDNPLFNFHAVNNNGLPPLCASAPSGSVSTSLAGGFHLMYYIHCNQDNFNVLVELAVANLYGLCPAFDANKNSNLFGHYFGIKFAYDGHSYVCAISPFEFVSCFCMTDQTSLLINCHILPICSVMMQPCHQ